MEAHGRPVVEGPERRAARPDVDPDPIGQPVPRRARRDYVGPDVWAELAEPVERVDQDVGALDREPVVERDDAPLAPVERPVEGELTGVDRVGDDAEDRRPVRLDGLGDPPSDGDAHEREVPRGLGGRAEVALVVLEEVEADGSAAAPPSPAGGAPPRVGRPRVVPPREAGDPGGGLVSSCNNGVERQGAQPPHRRRLDGLDARRPVQRRVRNTVEPVPHTDGRPEHSPPHARLAARRGDRDRVPARRQPLGVPVHDGRPPHRDADRRGEHEEDAHGQ